MLPLYNYRAEMRASGPQTRNTTATISTVTLLPGLSPVPGQQSARPEHSSSPSGRAEDEAMRTTARPSHRDTLPRATPPKPAAPRPATRRPDRSCRAQL
ncbi:hypothetical protein EJ06DRAFT_141133 [Trichodelitschia bisporula]|uniref:Uncharacterized protein n=1 Tax=Trichodelitschia bisporula TaxID=703511 RepID=A0A6G1HQ16_9PEZI|nr:hypothetical protein EJ06DRAFT_141133 [Trichodelitschia bisporula]